MLLFCRLLLSWGSLARKWTSLSWTTPNPASAGTGRTAPWVTLPGPSSLIEVDFGRGHHSVVALPLTIYRHNLTQIPSLSPLPQLRPPLYRKDRDTRSQNSLLSLSLPLLRLSPWSAVLRLCRPNWLEEMGESVIFWLRVSVGKGKSYLGFEVSCNNAIFTFCLSICAYVICLQKGIKIKRHILTEHIAILPDKKEMGVLTDCCKTHGT